LGPTSLVSTQRVYFDFDTNTAGADYVYTVAERDTIVAGVASIYSPWDFTFSHSAVPVAPYATLFFNAGPAGGLAQDLDFRNLDLGNTATIDVNTLVSGQANVVGLSTTVAAHELGHLVGLRHADSMGPIGSGLPPILTSNYGAKPASYTPQYPGPTAANETRVHTMASPVSVGQTLTEALNGTRMGERAAVKLEFIEAGTVSPEVIVPHNTFLTAQALTLPTFPVPNTAIAGDLNFGKSLFADAEVVTASIGLPAEIDYYSFTGTAGDIINAEVISQVPDRFAGNGIDPVVRLFHSDGITVVTQGTGTAFNDREFESFDSALIDVVLPVTGTFYVQVHSFPVAPGTSVDTGDYDFYLYRFRAEPVPEPSAITLMSLGIIGVANSGRRSHRRSSIGYLTRPE
jgi:hypothetical protein